MRAYERLDVWKVADALVISIYTLTKRLPAEERYGLATQLRRAAVSIPSNIAEGSGRDSDADFERFLSIAAGSASALANNVGDVQGEAGAALARTQDASALGRASRTRTPRELSLGVLNAANVGGRGTSELEYQLSLVERLWPDIEQATTSRHQARRVRRMRWGLLHASRAGSPRSEIRRPQGELRSPASPPAPLGDARSAGIPLPSSGHRGHHAA